MRNPLEDGVDERGDGRAAGKDDEDAEEQQGDDNGQKPVFFPGLHEAPQVGYKVHGLFSPKMDILLFLQRLGKIKGSLSSQLKFSQFLGVKRLQAGGAALSRPAAQLWPKPQ
jgi:hypothetical protein